jgi:Zn-dependent alcohol dehydrogenase
MTTPAVDEIRRSVFYATLANRIALRRYIVQGLFPVILGHEGGGIVSYTERW